MASASMMLAGCVSNDGLPEPTPMNPAEMYGVVARADSCPSLEPFAAVALPRNAWNEPEPHPDHAPIRARAVNPPSEDQAVWLSLIGGRGHHIGVESSVLAVKTSSGVWRVTSQVRSTNYVPPPEPGVAASAHEAVQMRTNAWDLSEDAQRRLDALLDSRCLAAEPRLLNFPATVNCLQGLGSFEMEVRRGGHRSRWRQECGRAGAAGEVVATILRFQS